MNSIRDEPVCLDTNEFIFALRHSTDRPACETLVLDKIPELSIYLPLQILLELQRNLTRLEIRGLILALTQARNVTWEYTPAPLERVQRWQRRGAKKGDAVIAAYLEAAHVPYLISENRHFLAEITDLPFQVLTSEQALSLLR